MKQILSRARLEKMLDACRSLKIAVLGDFALDAYWTVDMEQAQLSREAPLYNRPVVQENYSLGGAANVAWNLADLGIKDILAFSVLGNDWRARLLRDLLLEAGIQTDGCLTSSQWSTVLFAKIFLTATGLQQEDARIDFINTDPLLPEVESALLEHLEACLPELDALVISDYQARSVISTRVLRRLNSLAKRFPNIWFVVDSRERIRDYQNMVIKPNLLEASHAANLPAAADPLSDEDLLRAGQSLQVKTKKSVFITLAERGCLIIDANSSVHIPALKIPAPIDTVGAGDTFLSALAASLAAGASSSEAASIACLAAAVTIRKLNVTGTATPAEILALFDEFQAADL